MPNRARVVVIFFSLFLAGSHAAWARPVVLFPPNYNAQYPYPVVFFLPPLVQPGRKKFSFDKRPIRGRIAQPYELSQTARPGAV
jgi:hypothetical protein